MAFTVRRPLVIAGLGITAGGWALELLHPSSLHLGSSVVWGALALGSGLWWLGQKPTTIDLGLPAKPVDRAAVEKTFASVETMIQHLSTEIDRVGGDATIPERLRQALAALTPELSRSQISMAMLGGKGTGKSLLAQRLPIFLSRAESDAIATLPTLPAAADRDPEPANTGEQADLVMFLTTGDLTDSDFQALKALIARPQRVLLVFNKHDQYLPDDRLLVLQQLKDHVQGYLAPEDVVAIAVDPAPVKVRRIQPDGTSLETVERPNPDLSALVGRVKQVLADEGPQLILTTVQRKALVLKAEAVSELNRLRRDRAMPLIEQAQWIAGGSAFANPLPSLDLLATAAINTQMIMDLGALYQQSFTLDQAREVASTMAGLMVKLGLVEMTSQAIAPLLKSHAATYVAGGLMQGISAAYLTRLAGLSLVEYFEERSFSAEPATGSFWQLDKLSQKLQAVFQANERTAFLQTLVKQGVSRLLPQTQAALPAAN